MKNFHATIFTLLFGLFLLTGTLSANAAEGDFYIAPGIQWMNFHNDLDLHNDEGWALGIGYGLSDSVSVELNYFGMDPQGPLGDVELDQLRADLVFDLETSIGVFEPFFVTGFGHHNFESDEETAWNLGAGLVYSFNDRLQFRVAARNFFILDRETNDLGIDLALVYRFGGETRAAAPTPASTPTPTPTPTPTQVPDSDGDGVPDNRDACPDTPMNYAVDDRGCPIPVEEVARVELDVQFEFDSAVVRPGYFDEIETVADFMEQYPEVVVTLEGHTDSAGAEQYNQNLSERRANAVRDVLIERFGIQGSRISSVGYGESQPVASNATPAGREQNRRVITVVVKTLQSYRPR